MKNKYLFLFLIFFHIANADILYVKKNRCISDDYHFSNGRFYYTYSSTGTHTSSKAFKSSDLEHGYEFVDGKCQKIQVLKNTGMSYEEFKLMSALTGLLLGFTLFFSIIHIFMQKD